ncbi:hypothetical protein GGQ20_001347 [Salinibacter ruber]|nr:hypothetical protein [Salinibacter ruber]
MSSRSKLFWSKVRAPVALSRAPFRFPMSKLSISCTTEMSLFDDSTSNRESKSDDVVSIRGSNSLFGPPRNVKVFSCTSGVLISVSVLMDGDGSPVGTSHPTRVMNVSAATVRGHQLA